MSSDRILKSFLPVRTPVESQGLGDTICHHHQHVRRPDRNRLRFENGIELHADDGSAGFQCFEHVAAQQQRWRVPGVTIVQAPSIR